jgi:hypothetical protein
VKLKNKVLGTVEASAEKNESANVMINGEMAKGYHHYDFEWCTHVGFMAAAAEKCWNLKRMSNGMQFVRQPPLISMPLHHTLQHVLLHFSLHFFLFPTAPSRRRTRLLNVINSITNAFLLLLRTVEMRGKTWNIIRLQHRAACLSHNFLALLLHAISLAAFCSAEAANDLQKLHNFHGAKRTEERNWWEFFRCTSLTHPAIRCSSEKCQWTPQASLFYVSNRFVYWLLAFFICLAGGRAEMQKCFEKMLQHVMGLSEIEWKKLRL